jgi:hypothetical protein
MPPVLIYWYTLRHLRFVQLFGRIWFRLYRPRADLKPAPPVRQGLGTWLQPVHKPVTMCAEDEFCFLNETRRLVPGDWDNAGLG